MDTQNETENSPKNVCKYCDYNCFKNSDMNKHILTKKHIAREKEYNMDTKNTTPKIHICECGKRFSYHSGLWKHKKNLLCSATNSPNGDKNNMNTNKVKTNSFILLRTIWSLYSNIIYRVSLVGI